MQCGDWKSFLSGMGGEGGKQRERQGKKKVRVGCRAERRREGGFLGKDVKHLNNINLKYANATYNARHSHIVLCL